MVRRVAARYAHARLPRPLCLAVVATALLGGVAVPAHAAPERPLAVLSAVEQARVSGERVELADEGTERAKVFVNPDGSRTLESRPHPVRVRRDGGWVPVDTGLRERADGAVEPAATSAGLVFSGGGDAPLVRLSKGDKDVALTWPGALPEPRLNGDSATYPEVLPGVDLVVNARVEGFSQVLVVKTAAAVANPALARLRFGARGTGVTLRTDEADNLRAVDAAGTAVFTSATPMMWDSSGSDPQRGEVSSPKGPATGAKRAVIDVEVKPGAIEVVPEQALFTSPQTVYPVYVDPPFSAGRFGGTELWYHASGDSNWNNWYEGLARVGHETRDGQTVRSVWTFDLSPLRDKIVKSAWFQILQTYSWTCTPSTVHLSRTSAAGPGTSWSNIGWYDIVDSTDYKGGASCPNTGIDLNALGAVASVVSANGTEISLGLWAEDESSVNGWRKFDPNPALNITYNSRPNAPSELSTDGTGCATGNDRPFIRNPNPELSARLTDPDGAENPLLNARFYYGYVGGSDISSVGIDSVANGQIARVSFPAGTFADGGSYAWTAGAGDYQDVSPRSTFCEFTVDTTPPAQPPTVVSGDFPTGDQFHGIAGTSGAFTLSANGVGDVAGFRYGYENPPLTYVKASSLGGSATVRITAKHLGRNVVYVQSVDRAGNVNTNQPAAYSFNADQQTAWTGRWLLDGNGTDSADVPHNATPSSSGVTWITGRDGQAAQLDGDTGGLSTSQSVVATDKSFSVAAWVKLDHKGGWYNAVSQDGGVNSGFVLQYSHSSDRWAFDTANGDTAGAGESWVNSNVVPETDVWTRLIGVYDAASGEIKLYVNGVFQNSAKRTTPWNATGGLQIGRAKQNGAEIGRFPGAVDDVVVYDRVLVAEDIAELSNRPAVMESHWAFDETVPAGTPQPTINPGAAWVPGRGQGQLALDLDGNRGSLSTTQPAVRTDQSFSVAAWVKLDHKGGWYNAVSQDGGVNSGFVLQYAHSSDRWSFDAPNADTSGVPETWVNSPTAAQTGTWTHLTGVYDATAGNLRLYVDGVGGTAVSKTTSWNATGSLLVGRGKQAGAALGYFPGLVQDVHLYDRALSAAEASSLHQGNAPGGTAWRLDPTGRAAADESPKHSTATLVGGSSLNDGLLVLDGTSGYATTTGPAVRTDQSFSVVAEVALDRTGGWFPVVSQAGNQASGFYLEYSESAGTWVFAMEDADRVGPLESAVRATSPVTTGTAVHLAAVYDAAAGELRLYIDGKPQGNPVRHVSTWHAGGPVQIGQAKYNGVPLGFFPGSIGDARLYQGVLTTTEIKQLAAG